MESRLRGLADLERGAYMPKQTQKGCEVKYAARCSDQSLPCGRPAIAECSDCGIPICEDCRMESSYGESWCVQCYVYHTRHVEAPKPGGRVGHKAHEQRKSA